MSSDAILVLAPIGNDATLTARLLKEAGIFAVVVADIAELVAAIGKGCGAIMVAEEALGDYAVKQLLEALDQQPSWSDIPIILITSSGQPTHALLQRLSVFGPAGIVSLLERPFRPMAMLNAAQVALRSRRRQYEVRDLLQERDALLATLEQRVAQRTAELSESNAQLEEMVYTIAHDLRSPLRSIQGFASMILEDARLSEDTSSLAERVVRSAAAMDKLTVDLLEYGRMARANIIIERVSLAEAWKLAVNQCQAAIDEKEATIEVQHPLPEVRAHLPTVTQVIANLLSNALKFVSSGVKPRIQVGAESNGEMVRFWLEDNGIGIAPEFHDRIFRVFERLDGSRFKGTGVGLSIVRKGIERLNGRVGLRSNLGKGACFWFELPLAPAKRVTPSLADHDCSTAVSAQARNGPFV